MQRLIPFALLLLIISCGTHSNDDNVIARVGGSTLRQKDLLMMIPETKDGLPLTEEFVNSIVSNWIQKEVLFQKAKEYHFDRDDYLKVKVNNFFRDLTIDSYVRYILQSNVTTSETEIRNYYSKNKGVFVRDLDEAKVSSVVVKNFEEALSIKGTLNSRNSKDLDNLFSKYAFETKFIRRGESLKELDKTIFESPPRKIYGPIASDYGFHIVEVLETFKSGSVRPIDEVRDEIIQRLTEQKIQENYNHYADSLVTIANYEINQKNISKLLGKQ